MRLFVRYDDRSTKKLQTDEKKSETSNKMQQICILKLYVFIKQQLVYILNVVLYENALQYLQSKNYKHNG